MEIRAFFSADTKQLDSASQKLEQLGVRGENAGAGIAGGMDKAGAQTTATSAALKGLGGILGTLGLANLASDAMNTYRSFESMNASLKTMTGSAIEADKAFAQIEEFAKTTPYNLAQSVEGFTKLKALGLDPSMEALRSYGNTASAMGKDMMQMVEAVADASTFEFERLKEFGIKSSQEKDKVSFTFQGVTTTVKKNSDEIQKYLLAIGNNQFGTAMADQMDSVNGSVSNTQDIFAKLQRTFIEQTGAADLFKASLGGISSVMESTIIALESGSVSFEAMGLVVAGLAIFLSRNMITAAAAFIGSQLKVAASTAASTAAFTRQTLAAGSLAVSQIAAGGSVNTTSAAFLRQVGAAGAATAASRGLGVAMALLGGPVGLFALAAIALFAYREEIHEAVTHTGQLNKVTRETSEIVKQAEKSAYDYADATLEQRKQIRGATEDKLLLADATLKAAKADVLAAQEKLKAAQAYDQIASDDPTNISLTDTRQRELESATAIFDEQAKRIDGLNSSLASMTRAHAGLEPVVRKTTEASVGMSSAQEKSTDVLKKSNSTTGTSTGLKQKLTEAEKLQNKAVAEAAKLTASLRTPQEEYNDTISRAKELLDSKLITQETYTRLLASEETALSKATAATEKVVTAKVKLTDAEKAAKTTADELAKAKEVAIDNELKSTEALGVAQKAIQMTDEELRALTLTHTHGYTPALAESQAANESEIKVLQDKRATYQQLSSMTDELSDLTENLTILQRSGTDALEDSKVVQAATNELTEKGIDLESDLAKEYINTAKSIADVTKQQEEYSKLLADAKSLYESTRTDAEKYAVVVDELEELLSAGVITQDIYNRALIDAQESYTDAGKAAAAYEKESGDLADQLKVLEARLYGGESVARRAELANKGYNQSQINGRMADEARIKSTEDQIAAFDDLKEAAGGIAESIVGGDWSGALDQIKNVFLDPLKKNLSDTISSFLSNGSGGGLLGGLQSSFSGMMGGLSNGISSLFGGGGLGSMMGALGPVGLISAAIPLITSLFSSGPQEVKGTFGSFGSTVQSQTSISNAEDRTFYQSGRSNREFFRNSEFGQYGVLHDGSQSIGRDDEGQIAALHAALDGMQALDNVIASFLPASTIERVKTNLDGLESNALNTEQMTRERLVKIFGSMDAELKHAFQGGVNAMAGTTEEIAARFQEIAQINEYAVPTFQQLGFNLGNTETKALAAAIGLSDAAGGLEQLMAGTQSYVDKFYTDTEKTNMVMSAAAASVGAFNAELGRTGDSAIDSREEFRAYVESLDLTTKAGQEAYAEAMAVVDSMYAVSESGQTLDEIMSSLPKAMLDNAKAMLDQSEIVEAAGDTTDDALNNVGDSLSDLATGAASVASEISLAAAKIASVNIQTATVSSSGAAIPQFASGGSYSGGLALVGEEGPELINFSQSGQIYTAAETAKLLSSSFSAPQQTVTSKDFTAANVFHVDSAEYSKMADRREQLEINASWGNGSYEPVAQIGERMRGAVSRTDWNSYATDILALQQEFEGLQPEVTAIAQAIDYSLPAYRNWTAEMIETHKRANEAIIIAREEAEVRAALLALQEQYISDYESQLTTAADLRYELQYGTEALERKKMAEAGLTEQIIDSKIALDAEVEALQSMAEAMEQMGQYALDLREAANDLRFDSDLGLASPAEQLAAARYEVEQLAAAALFDPDAAAALSGAATDFLSFSKEHDASSQAYVDNFNWATGLMDSIADQLESQYGSATSTSIAMNPPSVQQQISESPNVVDIRDARPVFQSQQQNTELQRENKKLTEAVEKLTGKVEMLTKEQQRSNGVTEKQGRSQLERQAETRDAVEDGNRIADRKKVAGGLL